MFGLLEETEGITLAILFVLVDGCGRRAKPLLGLVSDGLLTTPFLPEHFWATA